MPNTLSLAEAVWKGLMDLKARDNVKDAALADLLHTTERSISRWKTENKIGDSRVERGIKVLDSHGINWRNHMCFSVYDFSVDYQGNEANGWSRIPQVTTIDVPSQEYSFFGKTIHSQIGMPATVWTANSQYIKRWAELCFDVITYKTVRTYAQAANGPPNVLYIPNITKPLEIGEFKEKGITLSADPAVYPDLNNGLITIVNSVGIPSLAVELWQEDVRRTKSLLGKGKFLIVSVVGTGDTPEEVIQDFVNCILHAASCEPDAIEINGSCTNLLAGRRRRLEAVVFKDVNLATEILRRAKLALKDAKKDHIPILLKIGYLNPERLQHLVKKTKTYLDGYTAINTEPFKMYRELPTDDNKPHYLFPDPRHTAGVSGIAIKNYALQVISNLNLLRQRSDEYAIIGTGGVSTAEDFIAFRNAGADVVQCCTAANSDPFIAVKARDAFSKSQNTNIYPKNIISPSIENQIYEDIENTSKKIGIEVTLSEARFFVSQYKKELNNAMSNIKGQSASTKARTAHRPNLEYWEEMIKNHKKLK